MTKKFTFLNAEQALVFVAQVNGRREHLKHYKNALKGEMLTEGEVAFLTKAIAELEKEIKELLSPTVKSWKNI